MASISLFLLVASWTWLVCLGGRAMHEPNRDVDDECAKRIEKKFSRFKHEFLIERCKNRRVWKDKSMKGSFKPKHELTSKHLDYLRSLSACKNPRCKPQKEESTVEASSPIAPQGAARSKRETRQRGASTTTKATTSVPAATTTIPAFGKSLRKDIRAMTDDERNRFFAALQTLKTQMIDGISKFDIFVSYHSPDTSPLAHHDASFLPFHREYLNNLEIALRQIDSSVSLPVWDSTFDSTLPNPSDSILWTQAYLGNNQGEVNSGPFGNWTTVPYEDLSENLSPTYKIVRAIGKNKWGEPLAHEDVATVLKAPDYQSLVSCDNDAFLELVHALVHVFVGGHMWYVPISPNDFVFWMHHAFIDQIWEMWRQTKQTYSQRETDFYVASKINNCNDTAAKIRDPLQPFEPKVVKDGLSNVYTDQFYTYQDRANCSNSCHDSPYLFCDQAKSVCMSKIRIGGNCTGYDGRDICYGSVCTGGVCALQKRR